MSQDQNITVNLSSKHKQKTKVRCKVAIYIMFIFLLASLLQKYIFYFSLIPTNSMNPNLKAGDKIFVNIIAPNYSRGSIIVFNYDGQTNYCKRLIGLPGEKVEIKRGNIYINDVIYKETFNFLGQYNEDITINLGEKEYYVLGDNRNTSKDSRAFGPIKDDQLVGSVSFKLFP